MAPCIALEKKADPEVGRRTDKRGLALRKTVPAADIFVHEKVVRKAILTLKTINIEILTRYTNIRSFLLHASCVNISK
jgi:hypothetical protein